MLENVKVYQAPKKATQSGTYGSQIWILESNVSPFQKKDSLMGWTGGSSPLRQIRLKFSSLEQALNYARCRNLRVEVLSSPQVKKPGVRGYHENFH